MKRVQWIMAGMAAGVASAMAHPGHGPLSEGVGHMLTSPVHLVPALLVGGALLAGAQMLKAQKARLALRATAALVVVAGVIL